MTSLDLRSLIILTGFMGLMLSVVIFFLRIGYPRNIRGMGLWALGPALIFLSTTMFAGRGVLPDLVSIVIANMVLLAGVSSYFLGGELFYGRRPRWRLWIGVFVVLAPLLYWFSLVEPSYAARIVVVNTLWLLSYLSMAWLVWQCEHRGFPKCFVLVVLLGHGLILLVRIFEGWIMKPPDGLLEPSFIQTLYITSNAVLILALGVGLILLASDRLRRELEHVASHDALTQVLTRRVFMDACAQELARCRRHGRSMALLLLDLDHFKAVNDTHGHQMGDRVLVNFAQRITGLLRRPDQFARFGGEEFVLLLPETTQEEAVTVAERILQRVAETSEGLPPITASIGLTTNRPDEDQIDALLARADRALYKAKDAGRNRVELG